MTVNEQIIQHFEGSSVRILTDFITGSNTVEYRFINEVKEVYPGSLQYSITNDTVNYWSDFSEQHTESLNKDQMKFIMDMIY